MVASAKSESWIGKFETNGWSVQVKPGLSEEDMQLLMESAPAVPKPMVDGPDPWVELLCKLFPERELKLVYPTPAQPGDKPVDGGPQVVWTDAERAAFMAAMEREAMNKAAELTGLAMTFFQQTAAELLADMEYRRLEFLAGRMPLPPHQREQAPAAQEHTKGEGCPLPRNAEPWTIHGCPCGARYRMYPPSQDPTHPGGWGRIDA